MSARAGDAMGGAALAGPAALEWRGVTLHAGAFTLRDVSLSLGPGEWIALTGPTGAGKTLLLEVAAGFLAPSAGSVHRRGADVTGAPPEARAIGYAPQDDLLFPHLSVRDNLLFGARRRGDRSHAERALARAAADLRIAHLLDRPVRGVSGGEAQRIAVGRALLSGADTLLLDECTSALDSETREIVGDVLARRRDQDALSVVQVTHDLDEAERLADRIVRIDAGRIVGEGAAGAWRGGARVIPLDGRGAP